MTDKKFEELLKETVEQCVEKEWEEISQKSKKIRYKSSKEFEEKMENMTVGLAELFAKSRTLEEEIRNNLGGIGYEF